MDKPNFLFLGQLLSQLVIRLKNCKDFTLYFEARGVVCSLVRAILLTVMRGTRSDIFRYDAISYFPSAKHALIMIPSRIRDRPSFSSRTKSFVSSLVVFPRISDSFLGRSAFQSRLPVNGRQRLLTGKRFTAQSPEKPVGYSRASRRQR